jgi:S1-C subfamily serine protease
VLDPHSSQESSSQDTQAATTRPIAPPESSAPRAKARSRGGVLGLVAGALIAGAAVGGVAGVVAGGQVGAPIRRDIATLTSSSAGSLSATSSPTQRVASAPATNPATPVADASSKPVASNVSLTSAAPTSEGYTSLYQQASPGVVYIEAQSGTSGGVGSGVVLDTSGHILTNFHVVDGAQKLTVTLSDGTSATARVLGTDPAGDLALIQADLPADRLTPLPLGDSDQVKPGQPVVAIGNPLGFDNTITSGIVSAVDRTQDEGGANSRPLRGLIQTDAAINPGNSGGPLLNTQGEVIGINTLGLGRGGAQGINFAVPINAYKVLQDRLLAGATIEHPYLGISGRDITPGNKDELGVTVDQGVLVIQAVTQGPAAKAGIRGGQGARGSERGGDVIVEVAGQPTDATSDIGRVLDSHQPGDVVQVKILRSGAEKTLDVTLQPWPSN